MGCGSRRLMLPRRAGWAAVTIPMSAWAGAEAAPADAVGTASRRARPKRRRMGSMVDGMVMMCPCAFWEMDLVDFVD